MKQISLIFLGGGLGSCARFFVSKYLNATQHGFPYGTLLVNTLGSFIIGVLAGLALKNSEFSPALTLLVATGFCGGFTTFSTFSLENQVFLENGDMIKFFVYTAASLVASLAMVFLGVWLTK